MHLHLPEAGSLPNGSNIYAQDKRQIWVQSGRQPWRRTSCVARNPLRAILDPLRLSSTTIVVSSRYFWGKGGIASIRRLSRPSGRIETQDVSGATDNPLGLDTSLGCVASARSYLDNVRFAQSNELMFVVRHETEWSAVKCNTERHSANASSLTTNEM